MIEALRDLGVGYIFLLLHNLYLKKENKVLEEDAYNTKIISLKKSTRGPTSVLRLCSLFQGRVHAGTLYLYSSKRSTLSTFVKINLSTFVKSTLNTLNFYLTLNTLNINQLQELTEEENKNKDCLTNRKEMRCYFGIKEYREDDEEY